MHKKLGVAAWSLFGLGVIFIGFGVVGWNFPGYRTQEWWIPSTTAAYTAWGCFLVALAIAAWVLMWVHRRRS